MKLGRNIALCVALATTPFAGAVSFTYDAAGRMTSADYGGGRAIAYTYDDAGNIVQEETAAPWFGPEDVDGSGSVNAVDVQLVVNGALGVPTGVPTDVNGDGRTDALDVQRIVNTALGLVSP